MMECLYEVIESIDGNYAIFEVPLSSGDIVYMKASHCYNGLFQWYVVIVDRVKFFELWAKDPSAEENKLATGGLKEWEADYKYNLAATGFSKGYENPVPLPTMICDYNSEKCEDYVSINNGITRTIWLASKGAEFIPVLCRERDGAKKLHELVGINGDSIRQLVELI
ncbi:plasmid fertility inhibition factor family protein [Aliivibrio sifiae]|nr:hypothetical protein [Aliivibrio sifiae]